MAKARVSKQQWIDAAVGAIARGGVGAVAVDALAKQVGITRGSFYWHFSDRDELLRAALWHWEQAGTDDVITALDTIADPRERLLALFATAVGDGPEGFEVALAADAAHPLVAPVLDRVTGRRLAYLETLFADAGHDAATARQQALTTYAVYVGWIHLRHTSPDRVPELHGGADGSRETVGRIVATLLGSPGRAAGPDPAGPVTACRPARPRPSRP